MFAECRSVDLVELFQEVNGVLLENPVIYFH